MLSDERLNEIKERCKKATKGPWKHTNINSVHGPKSLVCQDYDAEDEKEEERQDNDFRFIAHARTDIPDLLAEIERLRGELAARPNAQPMNAVIKNPPTAEEWGTKAVGKQGVVWGQCVICGEDLDQRGGANGYNYCFLCSIGQQPHQRVKQ